MSAHQLGYWLDSSLWVWVSSNGTKEMHDRDNMEVDNATQQLNIVSAISFDAWLWQGERTYSFIVTTKARTMYDLSSVGGSAVWDISWVDTRHIHKETAPELLWAVECFELAFISYRDQNNWSKCFPNSDGYNSMVQIWTSLTLSTCLLLQQGSTNCLWNMKMKAQP
jgi:hypothetical protein